MADDTDLKAVGWLYNQILLGVPSEFLDTSEKRRATGGKVDSVKLDREIRDYHISKTYQIAERDWIAGKTTWHGRKEIYGYIEKHFYVSERTVFTVLNKAGVTLRSRKRATFTAK